ncbi:MAG TPA: glycoside hydrolase family 43 protein [Chryseolinea sp.]
MTLSQAYAQSTYTNPVHNADFADPTVIRGHDGLFYAYATNTSVDNKFYNIQVALSSDLINWEVIGDALPQKPAWAASDFWAPHVLYDEGERRYYLYYSGESPDDKVGKCIGVAISERPTGPFIDTGSPLISGEGFTTIDPMAFDDPATGRKYLFWGSGHEPIKVRELNDDRISFKPASTATHVLPPNKDDYSKLVEGAWVHYREGYYYLFYSGDNCCGDKAHYAVMIARSKNVEGPFERLSEERKSNSSTILAKNKYWLAPGHNSVVTDDAGQDWIVYHAIALDPALRSAGRIMLVDPIRYKNGWPYLENNSPSVVERSTPSVKKNNSK